MRYLATIRHGEYEPDRAQFLTPRGQERVKMTAQNLQKVVGDGSVKILNSTELRAVRTAALISEELKVPYRRHQATPILFSGEDDPPQLEAIADLVELEGSAKAVILVSHVEVCEQFLEWFYEKQFARAITDSEFRFPLFEHGVGVVLDLTTPAFFLI